MGPTRSITDFFKPRPANTPPVPDSRAERPSDSNGPRRWPSAGIQPRAASPSHPLPTASPTSEQPSGPKSPMTTTKHDSRPSSPNGAPPTSQASFNSTSSHRIFKNGELVVTNSDSDTDSSDDELQLDLSKFKPKPKAPSSTQKVQNNVQSLNIRITGLTGSTSRSTGSVLGHRRAFRGPLKTHTASSAPSLDFLFEDMRKDAEREERMNTIRAELEKPLEDSQPPIKASLDEAGLAAVLDDEEGGKAQRVLLAIKRTNALQQNCSWRCFDQPTAKQFKASSRFPSHVLRQTWAATFDDSRKRDQAFLSGYASHVFQYQDLPEELALWMIDEITSRPADALIMEYLKLLSSYDQHLSTLLSPTKLDEIFQNLGAKPGLTRPTRIEPSFEAPQPQNGQLSPLLKGVILLLHEAAPSLRPDSRIHALRTLMIMSLDDSVLRNAELIRLTQEAIEAFFVAIPETEIASMLGELVSDLLTLLAHPSLQLRLVASLPSNNPFSAQFQRQLALAFFLYPTRLDIPLSSPSIPPLIYDHLQSSPKLKISKDTDYMALTALILLLDVAIGPGFTTVPYLPYSVPSSGLGTSASTPIPLSSLSAEEKAFNSQIDELVNRIKILANSIIEAGAMTDFARLDAKEASERLYRRLESAVRTRGRKRKVMFGNSEELENGGEYKKPISGWLKRFGSRNANGTGSPTG